MAQLPLFSRFFGIHPWDVERMTLREISDYLSTLQRLKSEGGDLWRVGS